MEVNPVFGLGASQFLMASRRMPVKLFVLNPFLVISPVSTRQIRKFLFILMMLMSRHHRVLSQN